MATAGRFLAASSCNSCFRHRERPSSSTSSMVVCVANRRRNVYCLAVQESSTSTVPAETKEKKEPNAEKEEKPTKPTAVAKTPVKDLPSTMEEDIIPSLKSTLEAQENISELQLAFIDNKLEGSFVSKNIPYSFWAFFSDGTMNGPKGFALSSYGLKVSTVEPFLVDEKKPTPMQVVFWVEKRLAAQGIIPVWQQD